MTLRGVTLWDAATGKEVGGIAAARPGGFLSPLAFSPDGVLLATASADQTITLWDVVSGDECFTLRGDNGEVTALSFRPDGQRLAAAGRQVKVWDVTRRPECRSLPDCLHGLSFGGDGRLAAVGQDLLKIWEPAAGRLSQSFPIRDRSVRDVALSPDGRILALAEERDIALRDTTNGRDLRSLHGHDDTVLRIVFRPDGRQLASGSADRTVKLWADNDGHLLHTLDRHEGGVPALAYRTDGRRLATGSSDGRVKVWDTETGEELRSFTAGKPVSDVAFSPDGGRLAWVAAGVVKVVDLNSGSDFSLSAADAGSVRAIAFHPEGERLATVGENRAVLWDAATGQPLLSLPGPFTGGGRVAFSPDGNRLAVLFSDAITVWSRDDGERARAVALRGDPEAGRDWHREQAEQLLRRRRWFAALVHLNRLLVERPRDSSLLALRGRAHAGREDWEAAAVDYRRAIEGGLAEPWVGIDEGLLLLRTGNRDGYRETCQALLRRSVDADTATTTARVVEACVLLPNAVKDFAPAAALLERALVRRPGFAPLMQLRGPALYRAGKYRDAVVVLEERVVDQERSRTVEEWLFLALARHQLGRKTEAREAFDQAVKESRRTEAATWQESLRRETLRQEAEALLGKE